jgi:hypothetical protein
MAFFVKSGVIMLPRRIRCDPHGQQFLTGDTVRLAPRHRPLARTDRRNLEVVAGARWPWAAVRLFSGYGLRASRTLATFAVVVVATAFLYTHSFFATVAPSASRLASGDGRLSLAPSRGWSEVARMVRSQMRRCFQEPRW